MKIKNNHSNSCYSEISRRNVRWRRLNWPQFFICVCGAILKFYLKSGKICDFCLSLEENQLPAATPWTPLPLCCLRALKTSYAVSTTAVKMDVNNRFLFDEILLGQAEISGMYWTCLPQIQPLLLIYFKGKFLTSSYNRNSLTQEQCEQI